MDSRVVLVVEEERVFREVIEFEEVGVRVTFYYGHTECERVFLSDDYLEGVEEEAHEIRRHFPVLDEILVVLVRHSDIEKIDVDVFRFVGLFFVFHMECPVIVLREVVEFHHVLILLHQKFIARLRLAYHFNQVSRNSIFSSRVSKFLGISILFKLFFSRVNNFFQ